jgi:hypothetical protein
MIVRAGSAFALCLWALAAHGCGIEPAVVAEKEPHVCDPGSVFSCYLPGCQAHQSCSSDGLVLTECTCNAGEGTGAGIEPRDGGDDDAGS